MKNIGNATKALILATGILTGGEAYALQDTTQNNMNACLTASKWMHNKGFHGESSTVVTMSDASAIEKDCQWLIHMMHEEWIKRFHEKWNEPKAFRKVNKQEFDAILQKLSNEYPQFRESSSPLLLQKLFSSYLIGVSNSNFEPMPVRKFSRKD